MRIIITENQLRLLENKTRYEFGFDLFKEIVCEKYPFIKDIVFDEFQVTRNRSKNDLKEDNFYLVRVKVYVDENEMENFTMDDENGWENPFEGRMDLYDPLEDILGNIYDRLPKNVRYNYPDNHVTWPGEAAGINVVELIKI